MAPITKEKRPVQTLQQALVELDKSTEGFPEQLLKAYKIAGIPLVDSSSLLEGIARSPQPGSFYTFSAKEEWILRWLLNRLQDTEEVGKSARSSPESWLLLTRLLGQIPLANAARLLNAHKFTTILEETSSEIRDLTNSLEEDFLADGLTRNSLDYSSNSSSSALADSSSTVVESFSEESAPKKPRKRKRPVPTIENVRIRSTVAERQRELSTLLLSVLESVRWIVRASKPSETYNAAFACEYMKSVLRTSPKAAAGILGRLLGSGTVVLGDLDHHSMTFQDGESWVEVLLDLWHNRSDSVDDGLGRISNAAFSSECLLSVAHLLSRYQSLIPHNAATKNTIRVLEHLLARHVFVPARTAYFATSRPNTHLVTGSGSKHEEPRLLIELLKPLQEAITNAGVEAGNTSHTKSSSHDLSIAVPSVLDIAIRCSPSPSPRRRLTERPWLQALFLGLARTVGLLFPSNSGPELEQTVITVLHRLLDVCIRRNVSLEANILREILHRSSGLLGEHHKLVNWELIGKVLKLDASVYLSSKNINDKSVGRTPTEPDLLRLLLSKITSTVTMAVSSEDYLLIKVQIIQALMLEFSRARDLGGFIEHWRRELTEFEEQNSTGDYERGYALSIWQDEDLSSRMREHLESSMTGQQSMQAINSAHGQMKSLQEACAYASEQPGTLASSVILDAILGTVTQEQTFDIFQVSIQQVYSTISRALVNTRYGAAHRWHMWRILARIHEHPPWIESLYGHKANGTEASPPASKELIADAKATVQRLVELGRSDPYIPHAADALEALHFLLALNSDFENSNNFFPSARLAMTESLDVAASMLLKNVPSPWDTKPPNLWFWNGNLETLNEGRLLVVPTLLLIFRFRSILRFVHTDVRKTLFRALQWAAYWELYLDSQQNGQKQSARQLQVAHLRQAFLADDGVLNNVSLKDDLLSTLQVGLTKHGTEDGEGKDYFPEDNEKDFMDFSIKAYLSLPLSIIHRQHREGLLNRLYQSSETATSVALMARLMEVPNASSTLATKPSALWDMVHRIEYLPISRDWDMLLANFESLVTSTLTHLINTKEQERSQSYLRAFQQRLQDYFDVHLGEAEIKSPGYYVTTSLVKASVSVFWLHQDTIASLDCGFDMRNIRRRYVQHLFSIVRTPDSDSQSPSYDYWQRDLHSVLDAMTIISSQWGSMEDKVRSTMEGIASKLIIKWESSASGANAGHANGVRIQPSLMVLVFEVIAGIPSILDNSIRQSLAITLLDFGTETGPGTRGLTCEKRRSVLSSFKRSMQGMAVEQRLDQLSGLEQVALIKEASISPLQLLGIVVATIDDTDGVPTELGHKLSNIFSRLCDALPRANTTPKICLIANIMEMMMRKKSWAVTQWCIDNALTAVVRCCSPEGPEFGTPNPGSVFIRLTKLLGTTLAVHRQKLGGRFHLVIPVMQGLLRCLFTPLRKGVVRPSKAVGQPPWLEGKDATLGMKEAAAYSRLLTALSDPTVSSVTSSRNRLKNELSDETKKAKAIAGQYLPYVLMEYTQCQLRSRMAPEVKAALMPGLHAVFDVMAQDTMRTLNAAMDSSNRAIFKDLYNDYRRFGKWNEK